MLRLRNSVLHSDGVWAVLTFLSLTGLDLLRMLPSALDATLPNTHAGSLRTLQTPSRCAVFLLGGPCTPQQLRKSFGPHTSAPPPFRSSAFPGRTPSPPLTNTPLQLRFLVWRSWWTLAELQRGATKAALLVGRRRPSPRAVFSTKLVWIGLHEQPQHLAQRTSLCPGI